MHKTVNKLTRELARALEQGKKTLIFSTYAPNQYEVRFAIGDYTSLEPLMDVLHSQLRTFCEETAAARQYKLLGGRIELSFTKDKRMAAGQVEVAASFAESSRSEMASAEPGVQTSDVAGQPAVLVLRQTGKAAQFLPLSKERQTIGRNGTDIVLEDPLSRVSRVHAEIIRRDGGYVLRDLESANGSFINGERVEERKLQHNDIICLGGVELEFLQRATTDNGGGNGQSSPNDCNETQEGTEPKCN